MLIARNIQHHFLIALNNPTSIVHYHWQFFFFFFACYKVLPPPLAIIGFAREQKKKKEYFLFFFISFKKESYIAQDARQGGNADLIFPLLSTGEYKLLYIYSYIYFTLLERRERHGISLGNVTSGYYVLLLPSGRERERNFLILQRTLSRFTSSPPSSTLYERASFFFVLTHLSIINFIFCLYIYVYE